ncbi:hypothetical protein BGX24_002932 [Mortierella sp. AD032]|nr:hypothetical protein BGX24_002932 [Mortierella sp. AD032]
MNTLGKSSMDLTSQETKVLTKFPRYQRKHHGVYDQLSRLARLKHLDLGFEGHFPQADQDEYDQLIINYINDYGENEAPSYLKPTFDTLKLSLDSGLDRLSALKDLEIFGC